MRSKISLSYLGVAQGGEGAAQLKTLACDERVGELALSFALSGAANAASEHKNGSTPTTTCIAS